MGHVQKNSRDSNKDRVEPPNSFDPVTGPISGDSAATSAVRTIHRPNPAAAHPPNPLFSPTIGPPNLFSHGGSELPRGKFASFGQSPLFYSTSSSEVVRKSGGGGGTEKSGGGRRRRGLTFTCWNRCGHTLGWPGSIGRSVLGCFLDRGCGKLPSFVRCLLVFLCAITCTDIVQ